MSMEIMQMLQVIPQAIPTAGTAPEVPAGSAATPDLFASLMAGLIIQPATTASAELLSSTADTSGPNDQQASDDIAAAEAAMMSLASLAAPQMIVPQAAPVTETPVPTGTTIEASVAIPAPQVSATSEPTTATASAPAPAMTAAMAPVAASPELPSQLPKAEAVIPQPELARETIQAKPPTTEAATAAPAPQASPAPQAALRPDPASTPVEVLSVILEPTKTAEVTPVKPQVSTPTPLPETAPAPALEATAAEKPAPRTMGPAAAYPDRIPVIPKGEPSPVAAEPAPEPEMAGRAETAPLAGVKPQEVKVVIRDESGMEQSLGEQGKNGSKTADLKAPAAPVQTDAAKPFEPTLATAVKPEHQPSHGLRDSIMAQVKEGIATREPAGNGEISIRLAPAELGELRISVRVVDQQVKVEVLAANSQVREILLNNLDSLKENFSRQNLTMTGFDVATGTGQGYEQLFRQGREAGHQGGFRTSHQRGTAEDEAPATQAAADYYYTDRRDSILDVRL